MSRIVWSPETGWTDDGPEATVGLDERGRLVITPVEHNVTTVEHGANRNLLYLSCSCGWQAGPHSWRVANHLATTHKGA